MAALFHALSLTVLALNSGLSAAQTAEAPKILQATPYTLRVPSDDPYRLVPVFRPPRPEAPKPFSRLPYAAEIEAAARMNGLDPALIHALVSVESGHRQDAVSPKGAKGLMQLMPQTARRYGVSRPERSPSENLAAGTRYLKDLLDMFDNRLDLALAAYNAGEGAVQRHGWRIPPYRETRDYVPMVIGKFELWREREAPEKMPKTYLTGTRLERNTTPLSTSAED